VHDFLATLVLVPSFARMNASSDKEAEACFHFVTNDLHSRDDFARFSLVNFLLQRLLHISISDDMFGC
jgi:hypothetical protein